RRHTRSKRDWSSDVCSSDLEDRAFAAARRAEQMSETGFAKMTDFDGTRPRSAYGKLTPDEEIAYYKARNLYLEMLIKLEKKKQFELEARRIMSQAPKTKKNGF